MLNWINRKMKRKGFTLIELVIVIAILGILIAIAVPRLAGFRDSAAERADEATAETIEKAAESLCCN
ncbi:MAG: prepilin-type N-terminal cleavage/methylation domain-containing protein [Tissierellaceae bacterium]